MTQEDTKQMNSQTQTPAGDHTLRGSRSSENKEKLQQIPFSAFQLNQKVIELTRIINKMGLEQRDLKDKLMNF